VFAPASIDPQSTALLLKLLPQFRGKGSNFYFHFQREISYQLEDPEVLLLGMLLVLSEEIKCKSHAEIIAGKGQKVKKCPRRTPVI
jgi:hypothetical protein